MQEQDEGKRRKTETDNMAEVPETMEVPEDAFDYSSMLIDDVFPVLLSFLDTRSLLNCRLVNRRWCFFATDATKAHTKAVKFVRDPHCKKLSKFVTTVERRELSRAFPVTKYHIDLSPRSPLMQELLVRLCRQISTEMCKKLKILFTIKPDNRVTAVDSARSRDGLMSFKKLESLEYLIRFYDEFSTDFLNMKEMLESSSGLKIISIALYSYIPKGNQHPIVSKILKSITSPANNFANLSVIGIDYSYLTAEHFRILKEWKHPIKNFAIGSFELKPDPKQGFPGEAFYDFLESRKDSIQRLRLRVDKEFPWEELREDEFYYDDSPDMDELHPDRDDLYGLVVERRRRLAHPERIKFPVMKNLISLDIMAATIMDIAWAWRMDEVIFPKHFPNLKRFALSQFLYARGDTTTFLPNPLKPSMSVEEVVLPNPKNHYDPGLMHCMISLFPKIRSLEVKYNRGLVEAIYESIPTLEILILNLGEEIVYLDVVLTGVTSLRASGPVTTKDMREFDLSKERNKPGLDSLKNLQELKIITEDYYVRITDITAHHVFLKMPNFKRLIVDAYPWEDTTSWLFKPDTMQLLKEKVHLELNVHMSTMRENLFKWD